MTFPFLEGVTLGPLKPGPPSEVISPALLAPSHVSLPTTGPLALFYGDSPE